jgi:phytoene dehydrogenase-like protein
VGATTLVDFEPGGVGAELLDAVGLPALDAEALPGYVAWLPDRVVTLHRDQAAWHAERLATLGAGAGHVAFWALLDRLADVFWAASRSGVRMPVRSAHDVIHNLRVLPVHQLPLARHVLDTLGGALRRFGLRDDRALVGLLGMLVEDTVHSTVDQAPLVNAALGVTIRGAGLSRHRGGMHGFWRGLVARYRALGGELRVGCHVSRVDGQAGAFRVATTRGTLDAGQVVSSLTAETTARVADATGVSARLRRYLDRDEADLGGAMVVCLGVPEDEVAGQPFTHHQLMHDYDRPLGDGNNMFMSVSAPGDVDSAPPGHRAVMISTHTELSRWEDLSPSGYAAHKRAAEDRLVELARRVYPTLGDRATIRETGTPHTYRSFTFRPRGAVGGVRQAPHNANQHAIPHELGVRGFWLVGDSTWPGLGTVACVLASRMVAEDVRHHARRYARAGSLR